MKTLHHHPLSPFCRKVRLVLSECNIPFEARIEKPWERRPEFMAVSPTGDVPVLVEGDGFALTDSTAICEYIQEIKPHPNLLGEDAKARAETRRLAGFFDRVFYQDVGMTLVAEKALKRLRGAGTPDAVTIRQGYVALDEHMKHVNWLAEQRNWLASDRLSLADITAAAQISVIDYLGDVPWDTYPEARNWYARIKSRPSFRQILADTIPGLPPPPNYANLDF
jgi:glutathione S-transferase